MQIIELKRPIFLASASQARRQLLKNTGLIFTTQIVDIDESAYPNENIGVYCERLALDKAKKAIPPTSDTIIIAVDTSIGLEKTIIGKPSDKQHAEEILRKLSGKSHDVVSAIALRNDLKKTINTSIVYTKVNFINLTTSIIEWYLATGEWRDRAGAYAIQGKGSALINSINGCFTNVIGLSIPTLIKMLGSV